MSSAAGLESRQQRFAAENPRTATGFADWVFRKFNPVRDDHESGGPHHKRRLRLGTIAHDYVQRFMETKWALRNVPNPSPLKWRLRFADNHEDKTSEVFVALRLLVDGKPIRCKPDCVLFHQETGEVLIIERKTTSNLGSMIPKSPSGKIMKVCRVFATSV